MNDVHFLHVTATYQSTHIKGLISWRIPLWVESRHPFDYGCLGYTEVGYIAY